MSLLNHSFEGELDVYCNTVGDDTSTIPPTFENYLTALRSRTGKQPLRLRIGGNSMDDSVYVPTQTTPMIQAIPGAHADDQPVNFGPVLWDVLDKVASNVGGASYLIGCTFSLAIFIRNFPLTRPTDSLGLTLRDPNSTNVPILAGMQCGPDKPESCAD